jgi:hypothetical protein
LKGGLRNITAEMPQECSPNDIAKWKLQRMGREMAGIPGQSGWFLERVTNVAVAVLLLRAADVSAAWLGEPPVGN